MAPFPEVLSLIETARQNAWAERSPKHITRRGHKGSGNQGGLPNSFSQPIYVPGKYLPSSCLSDKEEDEIYGFGGLTRPRVAMRVAPPMAQHGAITAAGGTNTVGPSLPPGLPYRCLSPRSAYIYEFPPIG